MIQLALWKALGPMRLIGTVKRTTAAAMVPAVFLSLVAYFMWQAQQGDRGTNTASQRALDLQRAKAELTRAESDLATWERRVAAMRASRVDSDTLDERARAMLNLSEPRDIIIPYPQGQRLF